MFFFYYGSYMMTIFLFIYLFFKSLQEGSVLSGMNRHYTLKDLINLETNIGQDQLPPNEQKERIVIGHNVSYGISNIFHFIEETIFKELIFFIRPSQSKGAVFCRQYPASIRRYYVSSHRS